MTTGRGGAAGTPASAKTTAAMVWAALAGVSDPEIPVLSIVDLGLVRDVRLEADTWIVTITPTYSGCPAMTVIHEEIGKALASLGLVSVTIETRLAPAWTTDWMSAAGRLALTRFGIAPPAERAIDITGLQRRKPAPAIACTRCGASNTRVLSQFGSTSCKALYRCLDCLETFDYFKSH